MEEYEGDNTLWLLLSRLYASTLIYERLLHMLSFLFFFSVLEYRYRIRIFENCLSFSKHNGFH